MQNINFIYLIAVWTIPVLLAITLHEAAHGWIAYHRGDHTAYMLGRVSLNPFRHIDLLGTVIVPAIFLFLGGIIFGWAKPVPVIGRKLRCPKRDMALVAAAGPISNILMALCWATLAKLNLQLIMNLFLQHMCQAGITINLSLAILNLIPIPPLDGSRILSFMLPTKLDFYFSQLERYGFIILLLLLTSNVLNAIILPPYHFALQAIAQLFGL